MSLNGQLPGPLLMPATLIRSFCYRLHDDDSDSCWMRESYGLIGKVMLDTAANIESDELA